MNEDFPLLNHVWWWALGFANMSCKPLKQPWRTDVAVHAVHTCTCNCLFTVHTCRSSYWVLDIKYECGECEERGRRKRMAGLDGEPSTEGVSRERERTGGESSGSLTSAGGKSTCMILMCPSRQQEYGTVPYGYCTIVVRTPARATPDTIG